MRRQRALLVAVTLLFSLLLSASAWAQRVVLVMPPAPDELLLEAFNRLRAELTLQGFETSVVSATASDVAAASAPDWLTALAQQQDAFAGILLTRGVDAPTAQICIADRVTGKTSLRTLAIDKQPGAPSILAVRAADLLRSSLRELGQGEKPPPEVVGVEVKPPPAAVRRWTELPAPRFRLEARAAAVGLNQSTGPGFGPGLGLSYQVLERLGLGLSLIGPAIGASYTAQSGTAVIHQELAVARLSLLAWRASLLELRPALALGVYHLDATGEVISPFIARHSQVTSFAGGLGLEADLRFSRALLLTSELAAFELAPRPGVAVLEQRYLLAWPFVTASVGIAVEL